MLNSDPVVNIKAYIITSYAFFYCLHDDRMTTDKSVCYSIYMRRGSLQSFSSNGIYHQAMTQHRRELKAGHHANRALADLTEIDLDTAARVVFDEALQDSELVSWFTALPIVYLSAHLFKIWLGGFTTVLNIATIFTCGVMMTFGFRACFRVAQNRQHVLDVFCAMGLSRRAAKKLRKRLHRQRRKWIQQGMSLHSDSGFDVFIEEIYAALSEKEKGLTEVKPLKAIEHMTL